MSLRRCATCIQIMVNMNKLELGCTVALTCVRQGFRRSNRISISIRKQRKTQAFTAESTSYTRKPESKFVRGVMDGPIYFNIRDI